MSRHGKARAIARIETEQDIAKFLAAADLVCPAPRTQGDVDRHWETRATADRRYYERRARQVMRVLTLPAGEAGHYMPGAPRRRARDAGERIFDPHHAIEDLNAAARSARSRGRRKDG